MGVMSTRLCLKDRLTPRLLALHHCDAAVRLLHRSDAEKSLPQNNSH